jgi:hypothetical protein
MTARIYFLNLSKVVLCLVTRFTCTAIVPPEWLLMHGIRQSEIVDGVVARQEEADIGRLRDLFAEYDAHMSGYLSYLGRQGLPQVEDVLEGIKRCTAFEPLLNAFDTSGRHYEQFGLTRLADLVENCREYSAKVLKRLKVTVFADPELPTPPMARNTPAIGYVMRRLADLHELVAKGTPYWIAYSIVEAKYRGVTPLYPDPGAAAPEPANPQA